MKLKITAFDSSGKPTTDYAKATGYALLDPDKPIYSGYSRLTKRKRKHKK